MNQLLVDYLYKIKVDDNLTYDPEEDARLLIENVNVEFPRLPEKEKKMIEDAMQQFIADEKEFCVTRDMSEENVLPSSIAGYELIWISSIGELSKKLID